MRAVMWRWSEFSPYLHRISEIARKAEVSPIEFADRQSILLLNPGLNGRLQVTNTIRCAISIYNPGDVAPVHLHSPNASRTILSDKGGYTVVEGERCTAGRGDLILTPNGTWHDHGNDSSEPVIWIDMFIFALGAFLAALGGVIGGAFLGIYPGLDFEMLPIAFAVVIIGGMGSLGGAAIGALLVGLADNFGKALFPEISYFTLYAPMALILAVKPTGLFGRE